MEVADLTDHQRSALDIPVSRKVFLQGPAGSGKTTVGTARLHQLIQSGVREDSILVLVPQRTLAQPYYDALRLYPDLPPGSQVEIITIGGLAQRMIRKYWPVIYQELGFTHLDPAPSFLTLETAQYYMDAIVRPLRQQGFFDTVRVEDSRLYSQILDNLSKAAAIGFSSSEIADRLKSAWIGKPEQVNVYEEVQTCANLFREFCMRNNLLDFSLQLELFCSKLWNESAWNGSRWMGLCKEYLLGQYRHVIYDNLEEDFPVAHDIVASWLPNMESALLIYDTEAGFRTFLGADPAGGLELSDACDEIVSFNQSLITPPPLEEFQQAMKDALCRRPIGAPNPSLRRHVSVAMRPFYPQMLEHVAETAAALVLNQNVAPGEIAILSPFLTDSLRFALANRLQKWQIPSRSHRPSRSLQDEPATQCLLTFAKLAHPEWEIQPTLHDVRYALMQAIDGMDLVRADLLGQITYSQSRFKQGLSSFYQINSQTASRITDRLGGRFETLRQWLTEYREGVRQELDVFLSRLFGEVLSMEGYRFHKDYDAASVAARLVESVQKFRWSTQSTGDNRPAGKEYIQLVENGLIAAQYLQPWFAKEEDAVLLAPAYTFLMYNRPVRFQFWLDIGSNGWWQRLDQPLTHPYVLSRRWPVGKKWTQADEIEYSQQGLSRLVGGLVARCAEGIFLYTTNVDAQGEEQRGQLLEALYYITRKNPDLLALDLGENR